jgi:hypothetical protein
VFDGEALADRLCRLKFERAREMGDLFHEARIGGDSAMDAQRGDQAEHAQHQAEALGALKVARRLGVWLRRALTGRFPAGGRFAS